MRCCFPECPDMLLSQLCLRVPVSYIFQIALCVIAVLTMTMVYLSDSILNDTFNSKR